MVSPPTLQYIQEKKEIYWTACDVMEGEEEDKDGGGGGGGGGKEVTATIADPLLSVCLYI